MIGVFCKSHITHVQTTVCNKQQLLAYNRVGRSLEHNILNRFSKNYLGSSHQLQNKVALLPFKGVMMCLCSSTGFSRRGRGISSESDDGKAPGVNSRRNAQKCADSHMANRHMVYYHTQSLEIIIPKILMLVPSTSRKSKQT